jgi:Domain of unknown function (DUF4262)
VIDRFQGRELDESERKVLGHIENHGWSVTNIREKDGALGWAFTVGLFENYGHPEVVIFGLKAESRHSILNWIGDNIREGKAFASGQEYDWVLDGLNCWSRDVQKQWYRDLVGWAIWFYGGTEFPCVQCIWPAPDGTYPWEANSTFFAAQPLLYETDMLSARMMHYVDDQELAKAEWPFAEDPHQHVFVSRCIVEDRAPIVLVVRDQEGDWQFIGPVDDPVEDGCKLSCFHCVVERDPSVRSLASLLPGWRAVRKNPGREWEIGQDPSAEEVE